MSLKSTAASAAVISVALLGGPSAAQAATATEVATFDKVSAVSLSSTIAAPTGVTLRPGATVSLVAPPATKSLNGKVKKVHMKDPVTGQVKTVKVKIATGEDAAGLRRNGGWWQWIWAGARWALKWVVRVCNWVGCWTWISW